MAEVDHPKIIVLEGDQTGQESLEEALQGKNIANPLAMILARAALLTFVRTQEADQVSGAIYESAFEALYQGVATPDVGGQSSTTEFTDEVIRRVTAKLEVWASMV